MPQEIERKFLVKGESWRKPARGQRYRQGYLSTHPDRAVRVRVGGEQAFLTIKGRTKGATRLEFEYAILLAEANDMLDALCERPLIDKTRYEIEYGGLKWEVDEFHGENHGLVLAEVELEHEDQQIAKPDWLGEEVTHDPRYYNANLIKQPYSTWTAARE